MKIVCGYFENLKCDEKFQKSYKLGIKIFCINIINRPHILAKHYLFLQKKFQNIFTKKNVTVCCHI